MQLFNKNLYYTKAVIKSNSIQFLDIKVTYIEYKQKQVMILFCGGKKKGKYVVKHFLKGNWWRLS